MKIDIFNSDDVQIDDDFIASKYECNKLPKKLSVLGNFDIRNTNISKLPSTLRVLGNFYTNNKIETLPKSLYVGKNFYIDMSSSIRSLPENLIVKGTLYFIPNEQSHYDEIQLPKKCQINTIELQYKVGINLEGHINNIKYVLFDGNKKPCSLETYLKRNHCKYLV